MVWDLGIVADPAIVDGRIGVVGEVAVVEEEGTIMFCQAIISSVVRTIRCTINKMASKTIQAIILLDDRFSLENTSSPIIMATMYFRVSFPINSNYEFKTN